MDKEKEIREELFNLLNTWSIDASEVTNGRTYIDSTEATVLTEGVLDILRRNKII
jgi:hypothetical protein